MKRFLIVLLFLFLPFSFPTFISAQPATTSTTTTTSTQSPWDKFIAWLFGLFVKTDYSISQRSSSDINSDMTDYGNLENETTFEQKHSFSGSRLTDSTSQNCLKGNVIKNVILGLEKNIYLDSELAQICPDSINGCITKKLNDSSISGCTTISVDDLGHYFVQKDENFYCDTEKNQFVIISDEIKTKIQELFSQNIDPKDEKCYQEIYNDFYITPKDATTTTEVNAKKIVKTPLPNNNQGGLTDTQQIKNKVDQNFSPVNYPDSGLSGLRPASWK